LAAGDVDGDGASDLLLAPVAWGWGTFRVLSGRLVASGTQSAIDTALAGGDTFGAPSAFSRTTNAYSSNGRLNLAAFDSDGDGQWEVYAAAGSSNMTSSTLVTGPNKGKGDLIRRLAFAGLSGWSSKPNTFTANATAVSGRGTRFTVTNGLTLS
jgi:hypothetical protein